MFSFHACYVENEPYASIISRCIEPQPLFCELTVHYASLSVAVGNHAGVCGGPSGFIWSAEDAGWSSQREYWTQSVPFFSFFFFSNSWVYLYYLPSIIWDFGSLTRYHVHPLSQTSSSWHKTLMTVVASGWGPSKNWARARRCSPKPKPREHRWRSSSNMPETKSMSRSGAGRRPRLTVRSWCVGWRAAHLLVAVCWFSLLFIQEVSFVLFLHFFITGPSNPADPGPPD